MVGYDAWAPSSQRYAASGGIVAESAAKCASSADVLILMVVNAKQASEVLFKQGCAACE